MKFGVQTWSHTLQTSEEGPAFSLESSRFIFNFRSRSEQMIKKPHRNGQGHSGQFGLPQVSAEDGADETDHERHRLRNNLRTV